MIGDDGSLMCLKGHSGDIPADNPLMFREFYETSPPPDLTSLISSAEDERRHTVPYIQATCPRMPFKPSARADRYGQSLLPSCFDRRVVAYVNPVTGWGM